MASDVRTARDYNRGVTAPIRWAHVAGALLLHVPRATWRWCAVDGRRDWAPPLALGVLGVAALLPLDRMLVRGAVRLNAMLGGDPARVLNWLGEFGQGMWVLIVAVVVWRIDPPRRRALLHWLLGVAAAAVALPVIKMLIGRPRPKFDDPWVFLGPLGQYPLGPGLGVHHAWEFWHPQVTGTAALWSLPSSHAAFAALMAVFLARAYPALRAPAVIMAGIVCATRIMHGSHYPSDVAAGAALGAAAGRVAMRRVAPRAA